MKIQEVDKCGGKKKGKPKAKNANDYDTMLLAYIEKEFKIDKK